MLNLRVKIKYFISFILLLSCIVFTSSNLSIVNASSAGDYNYEFTDSITLVNLVTTDDVQCFRYYLVDIGELEFGKINEGREYPFIEFTLDEQTGYYYGCIKSNCSADFWQQDFPMTEAVYCVVDKSGNSFECTNSSHKDLVSYGDCLDCRLKVVDPTWGSRHNVSTCVCGNSQICTKCTGGNVYPPSTSIYFEGADGSQDELVSLDTKVFVSANDLKTIFNTSSLVDFSENGCYNEITSSKDSLDGLIKNISDIAGFRKFKDSDGVLRSATLDDFDYRTTILVIERLKPFQFNDKEGTTDCEFDVRKRDTVFFSVQNAVTYMDKFNGYSTTEVKLSNDPNDKSKTLYDKQFWRFFNHRAFYAPSASENAEKSKGPYPYLVTETDLRQTMFSGQPLTSEQVNHIPEDGRLHNTGIVCYGHPVREPVTHNNYLLLYIPILHQPQVNTYYGAKFNSSVGETSLYYRDNTFLVEFLPSGEIVNDGALVSFLSDKFNDDTLKYNIAALQMRYMHSASYNDILSKRRLRWYWLC